MYNLGVAYDRGIGVTKRYKRALYWYEKAAHESNVEGLYAMALHFNCRSRLKDRDYKRAFLMCKRAASADHDRALNLLGIMYQNGIGVGINLEKAKDSYLKASRLGNAYGMNNVAWLILNKPCTSTDAQLAISFYRKSAAKGNIDAMLNLSHCYKTGLGVKKSERWHRYWETRAKNCEPDDK